MKRKNKKRKGSAELKKCVQRFFAVEVTQRCAVGKKLESLKAQMSQMQKMALIYSYCSRTIITKLKPACSPTTARQALQQY